MTRAPRRTSQSLRLPDALQPAEQWFPILQVSAAFARTEIKQAASKIQQLPVKRVLGDDREQREPIGQSFQTMKIAAVMWPSHAHQGDLAAASSHARVAQQFFQQAPARIKIEKRRSHWHHDCVDMHQKFGQCVVVKAARGVQNHVGGTGRRPEYLAVVDRPGQD